MPKVSKAAATSHMQVPGVMEAFGQETDGWTIGVHIPFYFAGLEIVDFTSIEDANRQLAIMAPNIRKYLEEEGMEVPPELQALTQ